MKSGRRKSKSIRRSKLRSRKTVKSKCRTLLSKKIGINLGAQHRGRYSSRAQAIAVSYSQVKKSHPTCSRYFTKK